MKIRMNRQHLDYLAGAVYDISDEAAGLWVANGLATLEKPTPEEAKFVADIAKAKNQKKPTP